MSEMEKNNVDSFIHERTANFQQHSWALHGHMTVDLKLNPYHATCCVDHSGYQPFVDQGPLHEYLASAQLVCLVVRWCLFRACLLF